MAPTPLNSRKKLTKKKAVTKPKKTAASPKVIKIRKKSGRIYQSKKPRPSVEFFKKVGRPFYIFWLALVSYPWRTVFSLGLTVFIIAASYSVHTLVFKDLPQPDELTQKQLPLSTKITDRNGTVLFKIYDQENRTLIPLSDVSDSMVKATLAIEDQDFYEHHGISFKGILRAARANLKSERLQGGSTITQQLIKMRLLTTERTWTRKAKESILAILVERRYSKEEILEMYFNQVSYGGSTYGIEEASYRYFNKSAKELELAESALLAGLPAAPSVYTPFGPTPELAFERQADVLRRMVEEEYITAEQATEARQKQLIFRTDSIEILAPHFVMYVRKLIADTYGEAALNQGGLEVRTSLDLGLQNQAQEIVTTEVTKLKKLNVSNGAALVTNPQTGEILSMIGSINYFDFEEDGQVNVTLRPRQPGSSIKPLMYALAFERGYTPASVIEDSPVIYQLPNAKPYSPKNYDGRFRGRVTLREALGSSYNVPAVKLLAEIGVNNLIDFGQSLGITTWQDRQRFGLSLTLGGGEVLMTEMAKVYGTFATNGYTVNINPILEVKNAQGQILYQNTCALQPGSCLTQRAIPSSTAYAITDILADNVARTPAFGPRSVLTIPNQQVAVKTGTTNNLRDNWTYGYTRDRLVAVWVGNNDNTPMSYVASGVTGASPIWNDIMGLLLDETKPHRFLVPEGIGPDFFSQRNTPLRSPSSSPSPTQPRRRLTPATFSQ